MVKNIDVCKRFVEGNYKLTNSKHLFIEKNPQGLIVLYSYGYHFPLCIKLLDNTFLINCSKYSNTTSRHTSNLKSCLVGCDVLSFTTEQLKQILDKNILNKSQLVEDKI